MVQISIQILSRIRYGTIGHGRFHEISMRVSILAESNIARERSVPESKYRAEHGDSSGRRDVDYHSNEDSTQTRASHAATRRQVRKTALRVVSVRTKIYANYARG